VPSNPKLDLVHNHPPFGALQITLDEVQSILLELDVSKGVGPVGMSPLILKNCASDFGRPLSLLFNRSLSTCVFPDQMETFLRDTDIQERQAQQCRGLSWVLSAIPKRFELLFYRTMHDDFKNLISVNQHGLMKN
jgi:hypothetical protein